jgi:hypothetical protein
MKVTRRFVIGSIVGLLAGAALGAAGVTQFTQRLVTVDGATSGPAYSFISDSDTGLYRSGSGEMAFSSNGTTTAKIGSAGVLTADGAQATPSLSFAGDTDTGFYRVGSGDIGVVSNASLIGKLNDSGFFAPNGSSAVPGLSFLNDPDTGIFENGSNSVGVTANAATVANFDASGLALSAGVSTGGASNYVKWKIFSCGSTSSTTGSLDCGAHGLSLSSIIGVSSCMRSTTVAQCSGGGSLGVRGLANTTNVLVAFDSLAAGTYTGIAIIYYQ